eukprot:g26892.t1
MSRRSFSFDATGCFTCSLGELQDIWGDDEEICLIQSKRRAKEAKEMSLEDAIQKAGELVKQLTFDEKFGLVKGVAYSDGDFNPPFGFFVGNTAAVERLKIPTLNLQDNGQGYRTTQKPIIGQVTAWPSTLAVAATWDRDLGYEWGQALGDEFFPKGGNVVLGPGLNVHRVARNGRNVEYLSGESAYLGSELVGGYIKGVLTVMKHFIVNSQETLRSFVNPEVSQKALWEVYYPPFQASIDAGCLSAMCAYNLVNGIHACANGDTMQRDLKDVMGFKGWIMSDWWALHSFAAAEGLDQEMPGNSPGDLPMNQTIAVLGSACQPEDNTEEMLNQWDLGNYYTVGGSGRVIPKDPVSILQGLQQLSTAKVVFDLSDDWKASVALAQTAELAVLCGATTSAEGRDRPNLKVDQEAFVVKVAQELKIPTVVVTLIPGAIVMPWIAHVDAALAAFLPGEATGLGIAQVLLGTTNPGAKSPVTFPLNESELGRPIPGGRDVNIVTATEDAIAPCEPPEGVKFETPDQSFPCPYDEGIMAGFPHYEDKKVQYPFGHGLSYTTFSYDDVTVVETASEGCDAKACVTVQITNTGPVAGAEVVQLYLVFPEDLGQPKKGLLRGFQKVNLPAGASKKPTNEILTALRQLLDERKKRSTGSDASWNSRQGPEKHVKWRGGAAPSPPAWKPQANDLRAFARWERRIEIWRLQVVAYMPPQDAALMLLTSLTGEAELEVEHLDLQKVHHRNGIQYILDTLREPLQQKQLFQKRTLLDSFEKLSRFPNESLRQYINRYRRVEKDLEAIGISSSNMYDSESKGNRLLERARLAPDLQRLVMIAAGNSLEYERIQEALNLQFPDFKPAPAVFQRERDNASRPPPSGKGSAFSSSSSTAASTWSSASSRPSSKGFGKHHPKRAFVAEQADELGDIPEQPEDEEPVDDDGFYEAEEEPAEATVDNDNTEDAPESEIQDAVAQLADVLTLRLPMLGLPPEWMQAWRSLVMKVMMLEFRALRAMARLVKFGLRPRRWMTAWELEELKKDHAKDMALQTKTTPPQPMSTCTHPEFRRYGNKHGSYAQCKRCMAKFQWNPDEEGWLQLGGDSSLRFTPLPLPSSDNIICPVTGLDAIQYKQGALAKSTPKAKAKSKKSATSSSASNTSRTMKGSGKGKSSVPTIHLPLQDDQAVWTPEEWEAHWEQIRADYHPNDVIMPDSDDPDQYPDDQDTPRCHYFDLQHCPCPVPLQRLEPVCTAEMEFPDGNYGTYTYEWKSSQPPNPVQWTGRTVFTIITQFNKNSLTSVKNRRKLLDEVRRALRVYEIEYVAMDGLREKRPVSQVDVFEVLDTSCDLLETFAGQANITRRAKTFGLKAIEPVDYSTGFDLSLIPDQQRVSSMIDRFKPLILIQGVDCKDWTLLQDNVNYLHRHIQLLKRRARARKILVQVAEWCVKQSQQGRYWLIENPLTSRLWQEPYILRLRDLPGTEEAICHAGAYGATNSKGQPIRKAHRFLGNCAPVLQRLQRRLSPEEQRACVPLEGRDTTLSAVYPPEMVKAILLGVRELAQQDDQHRFQRLGHRQTSFKVQMVHFTNSVENWLPAFEMADETFSRTSQRNYLDDGFDGTEEIKMPYSTHSCLNAYRQSPDYNGNGDSDDSEDGGPDLRGLQPSEAPALSRIEQKALDKELPWQFIMQQSEEYIEAFVKSAQDEESSWNQWASVRPLGQKEADTVFNTPHLRKRILKSRSAFRDKNKHIPPLKAKTRVVAIGCLDPDIYSLNRECATPTRQAEFVLLAFYICGKNKLLMSQESSWTLWSGDVKTAFLQGEQEGRAAPLYLAPPRDPITIRAKTFTAPLYEVKGNIYGLANAPRVWSLEVTKRLMKAGYVRHSLDRQLFAYYQKPPGSSDETLMSIVMVYVDDFLLAHDDRYDRDHVLQLFTWGSQTELTEKECICFKGKNISLKYDNEKQAFHREPRRFYCSEQDRLHDMFDVSFARAGGMSQAVPHQPICEDFPINPYCLEGTPERDWASSVGGIVMASGSTEAPEPVRELSPVRGPVGRGRQNTLPAWMTKKEEAPNPSIPDQGEAAPTTLALVESNGDAAEPASSSAETPVEPPPAMPALEIRGPAGRGRGKTIPAWMTQGVGQTATEREPGAPGKSETMRCRSLAFDPRIDKKPKIEVKDEDHEKRLASLDELFEERSGKAPAGGRPETVFSTRKSGGKGGKSRARSSWKEDPPEKEPWEVEEEQDDWQDQGGWGKQAWKPKKWQKTEDWSWDQNQSWKNQKNDSSWGKRKWENDGYDDGYQKKWQWEDKRNQWEGEDELFEEVFKDYEDDYEDYEPPPRKPPAPPLPRTKPSLALSNAAKAAAQSCAKELEDDYDYEAEATRVARPKYAEPTRPKTVMPPPKAPPVAPGVMPTISKATPVPPPPVLAELGSILTPKTGRGANPSAMDFDDLDEVEVVADAAEEKAAAERAAAAEKLSAERRAKLKEDAVEAPKEAPKAANGTNGASDAPSVPLWEVVGGADKGGILVRDGTGAKVEQLELKGQRLHYRLKSGPERHNGWISIALSGKDLAVLLRPHVPVLPRDTEPRCSGELAKAPVGWTPVSMPQLQEKHMQMELLQKMGPSWLTKAFHTAGSMPKDNKEYIGGGNCSKLVFDVEYEQPAPDLHTELFAKIPFPLAGNTLSDRMASSVMQMLSTSGHR